MGGFFKNDCGCNDCTWLIILLIILFCCGDNKCGCSCGIDSCWIIVIILLLCSCCGGNQTPCGC